MSHSFPFSWLFDVGEIEGGHGDDGLISVSVGKPLICSKSQVAKIPISYCFHTPPDREDFIGKIWTVRKFKL